MLQRIALATIVLWSLMGAAWAQLHPQDLLKESSVRAAWQAALRGERFERQDSWIPRFDGVGSPPTIVRDAAGRSWTVVELCQPRNCSDNKLFVLIDRSASAAWGVQITQNPARRRYFGAPDAGMRRLLDAAAAGTLAQASGGAAPAQNPPVGTASGSDGVIEGRLSFPSDFIPADMRICAEDAATKQLFCNARKRGARYTLSVPEGTYRVYATTREVPGMKAFYSEFVTCGIQAHCRSHRPIEVRVRAGETRRGIDPGDWYAPN